MLTTKPGSNLAASWSPSLRKAGTVTGFTYGFATSFEKRKTQIAKRKTRNAKRKTKKVFLSPQTTREILRVLSVSRVGRTIFCLPNAKRQTQRASQRDSKNAKRKSQNAKRKTQNAKRKKVSVNV